MGKKYICQYKNSKDLLVTEEVVADSEMAVKRSVILAHPLAEIVEVKLCEAKESRAVDRPQAKRVKNATSILIWLLTVIVLVLVGIVIYLVVAGKDSDAADVSAKSATGSKGVDYNDAYRNIVSISTKDSVATGFKLKIGRRVYLYTCYHCIQGAEKVTCRDSRDESLELGDLEFCYDRDLVRFELPNEKDGFALAGKDSLKIGEKVFAYGDTSGRGVMTQNKGQILAFGNHKVEIDAAVLNGNSGGPVLNESGHVIAVISSGSYENSIWAKDTRYEKVRKFAERADDGEWFAVVYEDYRDVYAFLHDTYVMTEELREYVKLTSGRTFKERIVRPFAYDQRYIGNNGYAKSIKDIYDTWNQASDMQDEKDRLWRKANGKVGSRVDENIYYDVVKKRNGYLRLAIYTLPLNLLRNARDELRSLDVDYLKGPREMLLKDIETIMIPAAESGREDMDRLDKESYENYKSDYDNARN